VGRRRVDPRSDHEIIVSVFRALLHAALALADADDLDRSPRARAQVTVVHLEEIAPEVTSPSLPQLAHDHVCMSSDYSLALRQADRARADFAAIEDDLDFL